MRRFKRTIKSIFSKNGFEIRRILKIDPEKYRTDYPYIENKETGGINLEIKEERQRQGGPFESDEIIELNRAIVQLSGTAKSIAEIGCGTGYFGYEISKNESVTIICSDLDEKVINWANNNRKRENITYLTRPIMQEDGPFDLVVAIEVIEHIDNYPQFFKNCIQLSPKAIFTTPNKNRTDKDYLTQPPLYIHHVREWTAGEFYWVLRSFYKSVQLFSIDSSYRTTDRIFPINILSRDTPLIAVCEYPLV